MIKSRCLVFFALAIALCVPAASAAAEAGLFRDVSPDALPARGAVEAPLPRQFRALEVDVDALEELLDRAPAERSAEAAEPLMLALPYPDGTNKQFRVEESSILDPALAARFPEIRTFIAQGFDDPTASGRLSLTPLGFHAMLLTASGTVIIDPYRRWEAQHVLSYFKEDARRPDGAAPFQCHVTDTAPAPERSFETKVSPSPEPPGGVSTGTQLRTYRLALAGTGEYTTKVCAPNPAAVSCGLAAMAVSINRVTGVYEREVAVRLTLIANNNLLVYTNGATDPYTNNDGFTMLGQNQANLDTVIGSANYDIGHVFSTGGGGVAGPSPCIAGFEARGVTGLPNPVGDVFDIDFVAHEMGHQFGAQHTFNGTTGACDGNLSEGSNYEPGSGSTIMAYAGICGAENLQLHSDDIFHTWSFEQIEAFTTGAGASSCPVVTATGNNPPVANAGPSYTIPKQTPFTLTGSATDPNGDALTYMWEEFDLGAAPAPPNNDIAAVRPIFRSFVPLTSPSRTFPKLSDILNNTETLGESMSTRNRVMTFRLTARDNRAGGGGVDFASTNVTVNATAGPFAVTLPNTAVTWLGDSVQAVTWNVAGTDAAPISCANVAIDLSTDGGTSFPNVLVASTPNDGIENVTLLNMPTTQGRIRVSCVGNIFFDISNANFTILTGVDTGLLDYYTLPPCRLADTRNANGPSGGPALNGGAVRTFPVTGICDVPADALAVSVNITAFQPTGSGALRLFPSGISAPLASAINFSSGTVRSNNGIVGLFGPTAGSIDVQADMSGTTHFILDVTGYFKGEDK